jgi:hypothetical protein
MGSNDSLSTRRRVPKATGAAFGAGGLTVATTGTAAAERMCLRQTQSVYEECPPTNFVGLVVEEGAEAFEACTVSGTQYYYVTDPSAPGYVGSWAVEPC